MPTTKKRLNITLSEEMDKDIQALARREKVPKATITAKLIREALELQEDTVLAALAEERMRTHTGQWLSHEEVWRK